MSELRNGTGASGLTGALTEERKLQLNSVLACLHEKHCASALSLTAATPIPAFWETVKMTVSILDFLFIYVFTGRISG